MTHMTASFRLIEGAVYC